MLVLLIMFIITIPLQTHAVKIDLPGIWKPVLVDPVKNKVVIDEGGRVLWNGQAVDLAGLADALQRSQEMRPLPELHIQPVAEAPYALAFDQTGQLIAGLGTTTGAGRLVEIAANGAVRSLGSGFSFPLGLGTDPRGYLYIADLVDNVVYRSTNSARGNHVYVPLVRR